MPFVLPGKMLVALRLCFTINFCCISFALHVDILLHVVCAVCCVASSSMLFALHVHILLHVVRNVCEYLLHVVCVAC